MDLRRLHLVALVGTQGRHAGGLGKEFSRSYRLRYSRDGRRWMDWKDRWGQEVRLEGEAPGNVSLLATLHTVSVTARAPASPDCLSLAASYLPVGFSNLPLPLQRTSVPLLPQICSFFLFSSGETYFPHSYV